MAEFSNAAINAMIDWLTGKTTPAAVATRYISIFNTDPQVNLTGEVLNTITGSPNRIAVTAAMAAAVAGAAANSSAITFTTSAVAGGTVNFVAIMDVQTGGTSANVMAATAVTSKTVAIGDGLSILIGNLTIAIV